MGVYCGSLQKAASVNNDKVTRQRTGAETINKTSIYSNSLENVN